MANKYIRHGETYCGDGTSSEAATSSGGVGAWNTLTYAEGTTPAYGTLVAGDTVYIRSKDASGNDITRTLTAHTNIGSAAATPTAPITWILDNGTVWSGINGTLTYTNGGSYAATYLANNVFVSKTRHAWTTRLTSTSQSASVAVIRGYTDGLAFDGGNRTNSVTPFVRIGPGATVVNPLLRFGRIAIVASDIAGAIAPIESVGGVQTLINPEIELMSSTPSGAVFSGEYFASGVMRVIGGRLFGVGAVSGQAVFVSYAINYANLCFCFETLGFLIPRSMDITNSQAQRVNSFEVSVSGSDDTFGGHIERLWGFATSRTDNNPPYLAATLPDSNLTAWSWRIWPRSASEALPMVLTNAKLYPGTAAVKTITQELLVANTMAPNAKNLWMEVTYVDDATGLIKSVSTRDYSAGTLTASTANWSSTVWGMVTLLKRKLEITTPTAIKQDTAITVTLMGTLGAATVNDIYFADPDFGVN